MDDALYTAAMEAQFVMGHTVPNPHVAMDRSTIVTWSWDEDQVRQALCVPLNTVWEQRVLELEVHGLASFGRWCAARHLRRRRHRARDPRLAGYAPGPVGVGGYSPRWRAHAGDPVRTALCPAGRVAGSPRALAACTDRV